MDPITIAMLAAGLGQTVAGFIGGGQAKKLAAENIRPEYQVNQNIIDNQKIAESLAGTGLSDSAKQAYTTASERGLTANIDALLKSGASPNEISEQSDIYNQGLQKFAIAEDQARFRNFDLLMKANQAKAEEEDKAWQINEYAPYADKAQLAAEKKQQSTQNIWGGISTMLSVGSEYEKGKMNPTAGIGQSTTMATPTPPAINYSGRTVATMNQLNLRPVTGYSSMLINRQNPYGDLLPYYEQPGFVGPH